MSTVPDLPYSTHVVGVRELSHHTSRFLARVRAGERLVVTDHGEPVAMVVPLRRGDFTLPAVGFAASGDPLWAVQAAEEMDGFGQ